MADPTVTITSGTPEAPGQRYYCTGTLTLASSYTTGGDTFTCKQFAMKTIEDLFLFTPRGASGGAISAIIYPVVRTKLPVRDGSILIQAFLDTNTEASGDLSTYVIPFMAWGVGS